MESWKKILYISWCIIFFHGVGMAMLIPFLPLYLKELGITNVRALSVWSGIIIGATPLAAGMLAPFWGTLSDKYGRKPLILRSTFGISIFVFLISQATDVYQLLFLRIMHGICGGVMPAFTALVAFNLPKDKTGEGLGMLQSAVFSGNIIGPFIGGLLADWLGYRELFLVISFFTLVAGIATLIFIHEPRRDPAKMRATVAHNIKLVMSTPNLRMVAVSIFTIQFALFIVQPVLPLFIASLSGKNDSATMVGLVFSVTGLTTLLFAPYWGKAGDRKGHKTILSQSLIFAGLAFFPQALVTAAYQLLPLRAVLGFFIAGIVPSTQTMIVKNTTDEQRGGVLGITHSVHACGHALGPLVGGIIGAVFGYRSVIMLTSLLLICIWYFFSKFVKKTDPPSISLVNGEL
jgi:DHA1 family multidrug resistance protein-like MFS transporter